MEYTIYDFLELLGSLALFLYGMKVMSEGIQKAAGDGFRRILSSMTRNRVFGVLTGFLITGIIQSSSATTVMTVSFVNAGLLSLTESAGIMMGANIGTTVTAWFLSILGFKVKIAAIAIPLIALGVPMLFVKKSNWRFWGETIIGFALLFYGLDLLKHSVPDIKSNPEMLSFVTQITDWGYFTYILFVLIGALLTVIIQSSSATMAVTLVMTAQGWITFEVAAAMVLGENIGTTITAELASLATNVHAKRSARIHSTFNIIGVTWMLLIFPFFLKFVVFVVGDGSLEELDANPEAIPIALSAFHTLFNLTNVLILINFVPQLVKLVTRMVPSKGKEDEEFHLEFITSPIVTPAISALEAQKEISRMAETVVKMSNFIEKQFNEKKEEKQLKFANKIAKYEELTDRYEEEISDYLSKISAMEQTGQTSENIQKMLGVVHNLENIADLFLNMSRTIQRKTKKKFWFTQDQRDNINNMIALLKDAVRQMQEQIEKWDIAPEDFAVAEKIEQKIDKKRKQLRKEYLSKIENGEYNIRSGVVYAELFNSSERIGDYIYNIAEILGDKQVTEAADAMES